MSGDAHVRFCERLGVRLPGPTHPDVELSKIKEEPFISSILDGSAVLIDLESHL